MNATRPARTVQVLVIVLAFMWPIMKMNRFVILGQGAVPVKRKLQLHPIKIPAANDRFM